MAAARTGRSALVLLAAAALVGLAFRGLAQRAEDVTARQPMPSDPLVILAGRGPDPTAEALVTAYVLPRLQNLSSAALLLQNAVVRACASSVNAAQEAAQDALAETVVAAARATVVDMVPDEDEVLASILVPVADTDASRTRFDAIANGTRAPPDDLAALALEEPGLTGLPALELLLRRIDAAPTLERCTMALTVAASVRVGAVRRERAFRTGSVAPHWGAARANDPLAGRQRLRDLVEALMLTVDRMGRDLDDFARRPSSNSALPFRSAEQMRTFLAAEAEALAAHARVVVLHADPRSDAAALLATAEAAFDRLGRALDAAAGQERDVDRGEFDMAEALILERLPLAFGFDPSAFRQPIAAYERGRVRPAEAP